MMKLTDSHDAIGGVIHNNVEPVAHGDVEARTAHTAPGTLINQHPAGTPLSASGNASGAFRALPNHAITVVSGSSRPVKLPGTNGNIGIVGRPTLPPQNLTGIRTPISSGPKKTVSSGNTVPIRGGGVQPVVGGSGGGVVTLPTAKQSFLMKLANGIFG